MAEDLFSVWNPNNIRNGVLPETLGKYDVHALNDFQKENLRWLRKQTIIDNNQYLNEHLEVRAIIREFLQQIFAECPVDINKFGRKFFSQPKEVLEELIKPHIEDLDKIRKENLGDGNSDTSPSSTKEDSQPSSKIFADFYKSVNLFKILNLQNSNFHPNSIKNNLEKSISPMEKSISSGEIGLSQSNDDPLNCECSDCLCEMEE